MPLSELFGLLDLSQEASKLLSMCGKLLNSFGDGLQEDHLIYKKDMGKEVGLLLQEHQQEQELSLPDNWEIDSLIWF